MILRPTTKVGCKRQTIDRHSKCNCTDNKRSGIGFGFGLLASRSGAYSDNGCRKNAMAMRAELCSPTVLPLNSIGQNACRPAFLSPPETERASSPHHMRQSSAWLPHSSKPRVLGCFLASKLHCYPLHSILLPKLDPIVGVW